jgi:hypothetical protein
MSNELSRSDRIHRLLAQGPLDLEKATAAFHQADDDRLGDARIARLVQRIDDKRWFADNVWSFGDDPLTMWMNQVADCGSELAVLELAQTQLDLGWSVVVKTPGSDELLSERRLGNWFAKAQDAAASMLCPPQSVVACGF